MNESAARLSEIFNFHALGFHLGTSGQPTPDQFAIIRESGYEAVINLALPTSDNAIANEGSIVTSLGMAYVHIPVNFENPTARDFQMFRRVLDSFAAHPVFVHCAANKRVSAFVFLYRVLAQGMPTAAAERDLLAIWQPDPIWRQFIQDQLAPPRRGQ